MLDLCMLQKVVAAARVLQPTGLLPTAPRLCLQRLMPALTTIENGIGEALCLLRQGNFL